MANWERFQYTPLSIDGTNYLSWALDTQSHLLSKSLQTTITEVDALTAPKRALALVFMRHHLTEPLKRQYLSEDNPKNLWDKLKARFDHTTTLFLPQARHDWINLRLQDFTSVSKYNSELFRITSELNLCGHPVDDAELIEKTLSTFHVTNMTLSTHYRTLRFATYSELISHLLLAEKHDELLVKNSKIRPPGTMAPHTTQESHYNNYQHSRGAKGGGSNNYNHGRGQVFDTRRRGRGGTTFKPNFRGGRHGGPRGGRHQARGGLHGRGEGRGSSNSSYVTNPSTSFTCFRCGTKGHTKRDCKIPSHLVDLYQKSKEPSHEAHGTFLESNDCLEEDLLFDDLEQELQPETHMAITQHSHLDLDDINTCIVDSATTHTILRNKECFSHIIPSQRKMTTIAGTSQIEEGHGPATITLPQGTTLAIQSAIYAPNARRNLLSVKDIRANGLHVHTNTHNKSEILHLVKETPHGMEIKETLFSYISGFYVTTIQSFHAQTKDVALSKLWHDRLGHPATSMFQRLMNGTSGLPPNISPSSLHDPCMACSQGKLITKPAPSKTVFKIPAFLERIHGDICGPIDPPSGPFRFFLVLIDASSKWSNVSLLSTRNLAFPRILSHILKLKAQFPENPIKILRMDNAGEFTSKTFEDFCIASGIDTQYPVPYVHFQNGIAESFIKRLQLIARPLLMHSNLPTSAWGHAILHASTLVRYRPSAYNSLTPHHLAFGVVPNVSHLRTFGCEVLVPINSPKRTKMGPQRQKGIYVGFDSPSIIRYMEPTTADIFKARFADCHFFENSFPKLALDNLKEKLTLQWQASSLFPTDPRTNQCESEVQRILHLSRIANELPDAFNDATQVTRSHIPAANTPARLTMAGPPAGEQPPRIKRGRPLGSKDSQPRQRRTTTLAAPTSLATTIQVLPTSHFPPEIENEEISIHYMHNGYKWQRDTTSINETFMCMIAQDILHPSPNPRTILEAQRMPDWPQWEKAINLELDSLIERQVFGPIVPTPPNGTPVGYRWTFVKKTNSKGEVSRYKARLVAKGYTQVPGRDYDLTYSPVMDSITYRFLIGFALSHNLRMQQMDVVTAFLYGKLDTTIFMKAPPELIQRKEFHSKGENLHESNPHLARLLGSRDISHVHKDSMHIDHVSKGHIDPYKMHENIPKSHGASSSKALKPHAQKGTAVQILRSMYGLKQSGRIWFKRFQEEMLTMGFSHDDIAPCLFIKQENKEFIVISVYVDDINIFGTQKICDHTTHMLKKSFEMKDLGKTSYCLGLQFEHLPNGILLHQSTYTHKLLKQFYMDKAHPVTSPMDVRALDNKKDIFRKRLPNEPLLGSHMPYLSAIGALMFLANQTRPDISFAVNLLARHSTQPTLRHWNGIKRIFRYLKGTPDMGLYFPKDAHQTLVGFADAGYLADSDDAKSQTGYVFMVGETAISWKSCKQTLTATSTKHAEIIALYETCQEALSLRSLISHIYSQCGFSPLTKPTTLYEDNQAVVHQVSKGYIKGPLTKHIAPKFFFTHEQQGEKVEVKWIPSKDNHADLFTKALQPALHQHHCHGIGLRRLSTLLSQDT